MPDFIYFFIFDISIYLSFAKVETLLAQELFYGPFMAVFVGDAPTRTGRIND